MGPLASLLLVLWGPAIGLTTASDYLGAKIGPISSDHHEVRGEVYAVDKKTLLIKNFNYDGKGFGGVVFWAGTGDKPNNSGFRVYSEKDKDETLPEIRNEDLILHLPEGIKVTDINWFSVWSINNSTSYGAVKIPQGLVPPQPLLIGSLAGSTYANSGDILVLDSQTFVIPDFHYDESEKDIHWTLSGSNIPNKDGTRLSEEYDGGLERKNGTLILSLPDGSSVFEYNFLNIWSVKGNIGFVALPANLNVPPSPRALKLERDNDETDNMNCEMLNDSLGLEVRWLINGNDIIIHLVGNLDDSEYMALGLSKDDTETLFDSADAAVTWVDEHENGHAIDYSFENTERCENGHGMCPDEIYPQGRNSLQLLSAIKSENITVVSFKRPLKADDQSYDQNIYTDGPQAVLWAVGPVEDGIFIGPPKLRTRGNLLLDFGRDPNWNCPPTKKAINVTSSTIRCPSDRIFRAHMGSDAKNRRVWFINGMPVPKLTLVRGTEYTFIVEAGKDSSHPKSFYITTDKDGNEDSNSFQVNDSSDEFFAGVDQVGISGIYLPISEGKLCQWNGSSIDSENSTQSQSTKKLTFVCEPGNYTKFNWMPDSRTPNIVYYKSSTMQTKVVGLIQIVDDCEIPDAKIYLKESKKVNTEEILDEILVSNGIKTVYKEIEDILDESKRENHVYDTDIFENSEQRTPEVNSGNSNDKKQIPINSEILNTLLMNKPNFDSLHPHDESERSDKNLEETETKTSDKKEQHIPVLRSQAEHYLVRPSRFKPQFEGGFVPLVLNPTKEKVSTLAYNFQSHLRRPYRPFLFNESIPFHGTFKPGVPDFSGFNISHYSNEDTVNLALDDLSLLSSSNSPMPSSVVPLSSLPASMRHQIAMSQMFGHGPRRPMPHMRFFPALDEMASQRVQLTLQNPNSNIRGMPNVPVMRMPEIKQKEHTPPIQRRPDIYKSDMPTNTQAKQLPSKRLPERFPNLNKNERPRIPPQSPIGVQNPYQRGIRRPMPGIDRPLHGLQGPNNQMMHSPHREAVSNFQLKQPHNTRMHGPIPGMQTKLRIHPSLVKPKPIENKKELESTNQTNNLHPLFNPTMIHPRLNPPIVARPQPLPVRPIATNNQELFKMGNGPPNSPSIIRNDNPRNQKLPQSYSPLKHVASKSTPESSQMDDENNQNVADQKLNPNLGQPIIKNISTEDQEIVLESNLQPLDSLESVEEVTIVPYNSKEESNRNVLDTTTNVPDYFYDEVPFGVRLKSPLNSGNRRRQQNRPRLTPFPRKPQLTSPTQESKKRPNFFSQTARPNQDVVNPKAIPIDQKQSIEMLKSTKSEKPSEVNETKESLESTKDSENLLKNDTQTSFENSPKESHNEKKLIPTNSTELRKTPSYVTYNLTIPQITEKPPTNDNGTDYSILNHVLSLIGNQPEVEIRNQNEVDLTEQPVSER